LETARQIEATSSRQYLHPATWKAAAVATEGASATEAGAEEAQARGSEQEVPVPVEPGLKFAKELKAKTEAWQAERRHSEDLGRSVMQALSSTSAVLAETLPMAEPSLTQMLEDTLTIEEEQARRARAFADEPILISDDVPATQPEGKHMIEKAQEATDENAQEAMIEKAQEAKDEKAQDAMDEKAPSDKVGKVGEDAARSGGQDEPAFNLQNMTLDLMHLRELGEQKEKAAATAVEGESGQTVRDATDEGEMAAETAVQGKIGQTVHDANDESEMAAATAAEGEIGQTVRDAKEMAAATAVEGEIGKDQVGQIAATDKAAAATEVEDAHGKEEVSKQLRLQRV
jgi:hypothetical protein